MAIIKSFFFFILAGLFEIGGGYLVWLWLKQDKPVWYGILGGCILAVMVWRLLCKQPALGAFMLLTVVYLL